MTRDATADSAMDVFQHSYYSQRPVNATFSGVHTYDALLPDWSADGLEQALQSMHRVRATLSKTGNTGVYTDKSLAISFLEIQTAEIESNHFQRANPSLHLGEAVFGVIGLMLREFAPPAQRAEHVVARLRGWQTFLDNARSVLTSPTTPVTWLKRTLRECLGAIELLQHGIGMWADEHELAEGLRGELAQASTDAAEALDGFTGWLRNQRGADTVLSCGPDLFDMLLSQGHRIDISRVELLEQAREALRVAKDDLEIFVSEASSGGIDAVHQRLAREHPRADRYLQTFHEQWNACRALADAKSLCSWPDWPIRYRYIPTWARNSSPFLYFLFYRSPPPFDDLPFVEYLVPVAHDANSLRAMNLSVIKQNHVAHHGALGHHVQNYYAYRADSPIGQIAAVDCASRIGMYCGGTMAEGWACYATDLMEEVGFLTPFESVSLQENRVKQIVRAVVDIELHQGSMSLREVERFFVQHTGVDRATARNETTKISMFPGTGMMYWYGTNRIHEMRAEEENAMGIKFSLRAFHDEFLKHGSLPVDVIAGRMAGDKAA